jgi:hypothetical protein
MADDGAAMNGHAKIVWYLHEKRGGNPTMRALDCAIERGHVDVVWLLVVRMSLISGKYTWFLEEVIAPDGTIDTVRFRELHSALLTH